MWCRVIQKPILDVLQEDVDNKCVNPSLDDCSLCFYCTAIGGTKLTEQELERVNKKISERKTNAD